MKITRSCRYPGTGYPESSVDSPEELGDNASICFIFVLSTLQYEIIKRFSVSIQSGAPNGNFWKISVRKTI